MGYKIWCGGFCLSLLLCSCLFQKTHSDLANDAMFSYAKEMKKQKHFELAGFGGAMMQDIQKFFLAFHSAKTPHLAEARKLYIETMEDFIHKVNNDTTLRPHLHEYPIRQPNFELELCFENSRSQPLSEQCVYYISIVKDRMYYRGYDPDTHTLFDIHEEPYEEALKIVQSMDGESTAEQP